MPRNPRLAGLTYCVKTFGCQMNFHDAERVSGLLDDCGLIEVETLDEADVVVFMTCCVRENADTRLYGQASAVASAAPAPASTPSPRLRSRSPLPSSPLSRPAPL